MHIGKGQVVELVLENGHRQARIACAADLIPSPGQYLLGGTASSIDPLPVSLYSTESTPRGFIAATPIPETWTPGTELTLRGPLGQGFEMPPSVRKVALVPFDDSSARLRGLIQPALVHRGRSRPAQRLGRRTPAGRGRSTAHYLHWKTSFHGRITLPSMYSRERLPELRERLSMRYRSSGKGEAQVLIYAPVPCGGVAECGVCAVTLKSGWRLSCKDGPVFDLGEI
jgi:hypothetical protein